MISKLSQLADRRIFVVGDVILDEYIWGHVRRISPEAPVPVVEVQRTTYHPGGAGNVVANIASLGGQAYVAGVVGADREGELLRSELSQRGVDLQCLVSLPDRSTITKTRVVAHSQQMVRLDRETVQSLSPSEEEMLLDLVRGPIAIVDACVLSDYAKGVLTPRICQTAIDMACAREIPIVVDPKGVRFDKYQGATVITPNLEEAELAFDALNNPFAGKAQSDPSVETVGKTLCTHYNTGILITCGAQGMSLIQTDRPTDGSYPRSSAPSL